ncbi:MAG: hypothetical protein AB7O59_21130 [Pirellulales bacterium]
MNYKATGKEMPELLADLQFAKLSMDRVVLRRIVKAMDSLTGNAEFTDSESKDWRRLSSAAIRESNMLAVPKHCAAILAFWHRYQRAA